MLGSLDDIAMSNKTYCFINRRYKANLIYLKFEIVASKPILKIKLKKALDQ